MSDVAQIYSILNSVAEQALGEKAITVVDTGSFISLGDAIVSSNTAVDKFVGALTDRIGRTVFSVRRYVSDSRQMVRHPFEYGTMLQKIYVDVPEYNENNAWEIGAENYVPEYAPVIKPSVKQKLFNKVSTWEVDMTIPDRILKTAFLNETAMAVFIDAIFTAMDNSMEMALEYCADLTRANFMANRLQNPTATTAINLLTAYNTATKASLKAEKALSDPDFLRYASLQIGLWTRRMSRMSRVFNTENYARHTPADLLVLDLLDEFVSGVSTYLMSDTFHDELVRLPYYNAVPFWQGSGTAFDVTSTSAINVKISNTGGGSDGTSPITVAANYILGVAYDYQAMGVTIVDRHTTTERNNKDEYTNYYSKANYGYFNDLSENGIVFYMAET